MTEGSSGGEDADRGAPLNLVEICSELCEKHHWLPWDIENLDRWWIAHILWHPRGKHGELKRSARQKPREPDKTPKERFWDFGRTWGWSEWYTQHRYETTLAELAEIEEKRRAAGVVQVGAGCVVTR